MDRICSALLEKICSLSTVGRYVIIAEDEFFDCFPEDCEKTDSELKKALKSLITGGYIDLKYSSGIMYCVAPLKNYAPEITAAPPLAEPSERRAISKNATSFWAAFAGGALGSLIISLIFAVIGYVG